jgi:hypothetical protein
MKPEELDRVLVVEAGVVPSSGFVSAVMEAVTSEAMGPPLPFPWKRALLLAAAFPALLVWMAFQPSELEVALPGPDVYTWFKTIAPMATGWVAAGLLMSVAMTAWSLRLVRLR